MKEYGKKEGVICNLVSLHSWLLGLMVLLFKENTFLENIILVGSRLVANQVAIQKPHLSKSLHNSKAVL